MADREKGKGKRPLFGYVSRPRDTPHGLILFLVSTYLPIP